VSEQERYGQEPYRPQEPYAPHAPDYPPQGPPAQPGYDPYTGAPQQGYDPQAYDPRHYPQHPQHPQHPQQQPYPPQPPQHPQQPYAQPGYPGQGYDRPQQPYGYDQPGPGQPQPAGGTGEFQMPRQRVAEAPQQPPMPGDGFDVDGRPVGEGEEGFHTEEFAFVEEADEQAEDVIDWLKFSESRAERRDERKRRGRTRIVALVVVLALAVVGGVGYLWQAGLLPGFGPASGSSVPLGDQKRDVIVVNLRQVESSDSSTALLVRNETTGRATMVLLPNTLTVSTDDGTTTLGRAVVDETSGPVRDGLSTLLGAKIQGTWRLDTPYLEILVDAVGGISLDTDATITSKGRPEVSAGKDQSLNGQAAVAYATYRGSGESEDRQLARFAQVMQAVLMKMPSDNATATKIVDDLSDVPDPSLSNNQLGATLAELSNLVKTGHYGSTTLSVQPNGTLSQQETSDVVKNILGGAVRNTDPSGIPAISVEDGTTDPKAAGAAQAAVVDSGSTYVDGGKTTPRATSQVLYSTPSGQKTAGELAKTLGLPANEVHKGAGAANAVVTVILGADYHPPTGTPLS
jgi:anionic cell wall polymer biosynthesis LytR-Cps2A-Psr (LCP) family protein